MSAQSADTGESKYDKVMINFTFFTLVTKECGFYVFFFCFVMHFLQIPFSIVKKNNIYNVRTPCPFPVIPCFLPVLEYTYRDYFLLSPQSTMIKKKQFVELLNNALDSEEEMSVHFYKYASDSLKYYKWLSDDQKEQLSEITTRLRDDCQKHKNMIEKLIKHIQESKENVF